MNSWLSPPLPTRSARIDYTIEIFSRYFLAVIVSVLAILWLKSVVNVPPNPKTIGNVGLTAAVMKAVVFAPIVEEFMFRKILRPQQAVITALILSLLTNLTIFMVSGLPLFTLYSALIIIGSTFAYFLIFKAYMSILKWLHDAVQRCIVPVVILLSFIFAYSHYTHVNFLERPYLLLILLPQFCFGIAASLIRLRCGFHWAVAIHVLHNSVLVATTYWALK